MSISVEQTQSTTWMYVHSVKTQKTQTHRQAWSFWRLRGTAVGWGSGGGWRVVAVFLDNKWWDALVSARPTEPDDRRAAKRSCDHITHFGALWEGPLSNRKGSEEQEEKEEGVTTHEPCSARCPLSTKLYTNKLLFFLFFFLFNGTCLSPTFWALTSISECVHYFVS